MKENEKMQEKLAILVKNVNKTFTLHNLGKELTALKDISFSLPFGKCLAINGPSGAGKSTLLRCLYGNYLISSGKIEISHRDTKVNLLFANPREILDLRKETLSYVSQFLRVIPRISALDIVASPLIDKGHKKTVARDKAGEILIKLNISEKLFDLPPLTFSGGERQRINIARGLIRESPIILLDEPTASLDYPNRLVAINLFLEAKKKGAAIVGIFHDKEVRDKVSDYLFELPAYADRDD